MNSVLKFCQNLVKFIEQKSGLKFNDYGIGRDLFNTLSIQKVHNYALPEWVNQTVLDCLQDFHEMSFIFDSSTPLIRRLRAGMPSETLYQLIQI